MEVSQAFSLTPAQHYRLKANALLLVGSPLPNMDRIIEGPAWHCTVTQDGSSHHIPSATSGTALCSDIGYATQSLMPHEVPTPTFLAVTVVFHLTISFPRVQRYNSMNSMNPVNGPSAAEDSTRHLYAGLLVLMVACFCCSPDHLAFLRMYA
ncbi:zinc finger protein GLI2-like protein [Lates japonicus]|uniref:Zinc finger protein GLI2-like protein n=1 Tax=Lates japonicus TaxID=270547 RepID=A0AAD3MUP5_LATJO|nr:zinc finger protein GLI2-like protein [Lates japonicus]